MVVYRPVKYGVRNSRGFSYSSYIRSNVLAVAKLIYEPEFFEIKEEPVEH